MNSRFKPSSERCTWAVGAKEQKFTLLCGIGRLAMSGNWAGIWIARSASYPKRKDDGVRTAVVCSCCRSRVPQTRGLNRGHFISRVLETWSLWSRSWHVWPPVKILPDSQMATSYYTIFFCAMWRKLVSPLISRVPVLWDRDPTQLKNDIRSKWL